MIHQRLFPFPLAPPLLPSDATHLLRHMRNEWCHGTRGRKKIQHSTLSLLLAPLSQWIFYKLSPEVHKHCEREQERLSERQRQAWGVPFRGPHKMFSCIKHAWTPAVAELTGRWQHLLHSSCKQDCVTQCFSALSADPAIHLALLYDYHKCLDCLHKNVEWRRGPPLPLVASFYWKGQVCPLGKAKTLTVLYSLSNRLCNQELG